MDATKFMTGIDAVEPLRNLPRTQHVSSHATRKVYKLPAFDNHSSTIDASHRNGNEDDLMRSPIDIETTTNEDTISIC